MHLVYNQMCERVEMWVRADAVSRQVCDLGSHLHCQGVALTNKPVGLRRDPLTKSTAAGVKAE